MGATRKTAILSQAQRGKQKTLVGERGVRRGHPGGDPQPRSLEDKWQDLTSKKRAHRSTENRAVATYQPHCQCFRFL